MLEARLWSAGAFDDLEGLWVISGGRNAERPLLSSVEQTRDGIKFEPFPAQLPKTLGLHCLVSLGKGDFFLAGGAEVCNGTLCFLI